MRAVGILLLTAGLSRMPAQEQPAYTFGTTVVSSSELQGRIYKVKKFTKRLPHFDRMHPEGTIYTKSLNVWPRSFDQGFPGITKRFEWFAIDYTGRIWINETGGYGFSLLSDDGAKLTIDGQTVVDNDGLHPPEAVTASAEMTRGVHEVRISYFQGPRFSVALVLAVAKVGGAWRLFSTDDFKPPQDVGELVQGQIRDIWPENNPVLEQLR